MLKRERPSSHRLAVAFAFTGAWAVALVGFGPSARAAQLTTARVGHAPAVPAGARATGSVSTSAKLDVDVVLQSSDAQALSAYAADVSNPDSADYRDYLTQSQFAARFGASQATVDSVEATLRSEGLTVDGEDSDGLVLHVSGAASGFEKAWNVSLEKYTLADGTTGFANSAAPQLPTATASKISEVVGLDSLVTLQSEAVRASSDEASQAAQSTAHLQSQASTGTTGPQETSACSSAISESDSSDNPLSWTFPDLAQAYGYDNLYGAGDLGQGETVALIEFASYQSSDISSFEDCFSSDPDPTITNVAVDGGAASSTGYGPGVDESGEEEAELDIETIIGLAPDAAIDVYEAPAAATDSDVLDVYTQAIDNSAVNVVSTSWGDCEAADDSSLVDSEATLFEQAAVEGKTLVAASGDSGAEDCDGTLGGSSGSALAVDDPASQPYVTGVGGTDLTAIGSSPTQSAWNGNDGDGLSGGAGGGGVSSLWAMPSYQSDAASSLNVVNADSTCSTGVGDCREVPDVSSDAGATVAVYCTEGGRDGCANGGWTGFGGTSVAAPTWAALFALADASTACEGSALGFANPALYTVASGSGYASAFSDVTTGNNDLLGDHDGTYAAGTGYDMATGLGTPIAGSGSGADSGLVTQLCRTARASDFATSTTAADAPSTEITVTKLSVKGGPKAGGTKVTITGTGFSGISAVHFGSKKATSFDVESTTKIVAVAPAGTGSVEVTVGDSVVTSSSVAAAKFAYLPVPKISRLSKRSGAKRGGTSVTITGTGFTDVTKVVFGTRKARSVRVVSPDKIVVVAPAQTGVRMIRVTTLGGTSRTRSALRFRYT